MRPIRRLLLIKLRGIGDVVLSTALIEPLRAGLPGVEIDFATSPPCDDLLAPLVDRVLVYTAGEDAGWLRGLRRAKYDAVLDLMGNPGTALWTRLTGAPIRLGVRRPRRTYAYTTALPPEPHLPVVEQEARMLDALGIARPSRIRLPDPTDAADRAQAAEELRPARALGKPLLGVIVGGGWPAKRCPPETLAELGAAVAVSRDAVPVVLSGPDDTADADRLEVELNRLLSDGTPVVRLPPTTLRRTVARYGALDAVLVNDSGPMHLAAMSGVPLVGLFGPTRPESHAPVSPVARAVQHLSPPCVPCELLRCPWPEAPTDGSIRHQACFRDLPLADVLAAFAAIWPRSPRPDHVTARDPV